MVWNVYCLASTKETIPGSALLDKEITGLERNMANARLIQREAIHVHPFPRTADELIKIATETKKTDIRIRLRLPSSVIQHARYDSTWRFSAPFRSRK